MADNTKEAVDKVLRPEGGTGTGGSSGQTSRLKESEAIDTLLQSSGAPDHVRKEFADNFKLLSQNEVTVDGKMITLDDQQITLSADMLASMEAARVVLLSNVSKIFKDGRKPGKEAWGTKEDPQKPGEFLSSGLDTSKKERLRFKEHREMVAPFLEKLGLTREDMPEDVKNNDTIALTRLFDLVNDGYRKDDKTFNELAQIKPALMEANKFAVKMGRKLEESNGKRTGRQHVELMQFYTNHLKSARGRQNWETKVKVDAKISELKGVVGYNDDELSLRLARLAVSLGENGGEKVAQQFGKENQGFADLPKVFVDAVAERINATPATETPGYAKAESDRKFSTIVRELKAADAAPAEKGTGEKEADYLARMKELVATKRAVQRTGETPEAYRERIAGNDPTIQKPGESDKAYRARIINLAKDGPASQQTGESPKDYRDRIEKQAASQLADKMADLKAEWEKKAKEDVKKSGRQDIETRVAQEWKDKAAKLTKKAPPPAMTVEEVMAAYEALEAVAAEPKPVQLGCNNLWDVDALATQVIRQAANLTFSSKSAAIYHAEKHFPELLDKSRFRAMMSLFDQASEGGTGAQVSLIEPSADRAASSKQEVGVPSGDASGSETKTEKKHRQSRRAHKAGEFDPQKRLIAYVDCAREAAAASSFEVKVLQLGNRLVTSSLYGMRTLTSVDQEKRALMLTFMQG